MRVIFVIGDAASLMNPTPLNPLTTYIFSPHIISLLSRGETHFMPKPAGGGAHSVRDDQVKISFEHFDGLSGITAPLKFRKYLHRVNRQVFVLDQSPHLAHTRRVAVDVQPIELGTGGSAR